MTRTPKYPLGTKLRFQDESGEFVVDKIEDEEGSELYYVQEAYPGLGGVYEREIFDTKEEAVKAREGGKLFVTCYVVRKQPKYPVGTKLRFRDEDEGFMVGKIEWDDVHECWYYVSTCDEYGSFEFEICESQEEADNKSEHDSSGIYVIKE